MDEQVQPDTSKTPFHNLPQEIKQSPNKLLETFKSQFVSDETSIGTTHVTKMQIDTGTSNLSHRGNTLLLWNTMTG